MRNRLLVCLSLLGFNNIAPAFEVADYSIVDLTHAYGDSTLYWPTSPTSFEKETLAYGDTEQGYFYSAYAVCTPEHGGTHIDAPVHFVRGGLTTDELHLKT